MSRRRDTEAQEHREASSGGLNPDSAVAIDATSEEQTFRSEANSSLPLSGRRSSVVDWKSKTYNNGVRKRETTLKLHGWVSSLLQARPSLVLAIGSTAESGLNYCLLAAQPLVLQPGYGEIKGEYVLADAVLREAIREYQKFARYQSRRGVKLFRDVDQWFSADDRDSCFSFINLCQILDLEPTYIRTGLQMWRERIAKQNAHDRHTAGNANGSPSLVAPV